mmetsp:Transcript_12756/g.28002  ORF Transcript_12756/g.28002 Transcript_12756/m.28002 type:complete len:501 (-) Transcript_12756:1210-2712(-)|eukprot:CAMPEP_0168737116 /NCGR_PEP_ID=MMETSP0724-20121128/10218_1 /TAXON_ID=265536 /ORGANISM="Amphiprora sp., Strain CCMP467" /LENGTH=500 /DNA_ID=CAMNT_0008784351 /DNA_START=117 /DNA_END=1619 /DNA_ORIENTATION=+
MSSTATQLEEASALLLMNHHNSSSSGSTRRQCLLETVPEDAEMRARRHPTRRNYRPKSITPINQPSRTSRRTPPPRKRAPTPPPQRTKHERSPRKKAASPSVVATRQTTTTARKLPVARLATSPSTQKKTAARSQDGERKKKFSTPRNHGPVATSTNKRNRSRRVGVTPDSSTREHSVTQREPRPLQQRHQNPQEGECAKTPLPPQPPSRSKVTPPPGTQEPRRPPLIKSYSTTSLSKLPRSSNRATTTRVRSRSVPKSNSYTRAELGVVLFPHNDCRNNKSIQSPVKTRKTKASSLPQDPKTKKKRQEQEYPYEFRARSVPKSTYQFRPVSPLERESSLQRLQQQLKRENEQRSQATPDRRAALSEQGKKSHSFRSRPVPVTTYCQPPILSKREQEAIHRSIEMRSVAKRQNSQKDLVSSPLSHPQRRPELPRQASVRGSVPARPEEHYGANPNATAVDPPPSPNNAVTTTTTSSTYGKKLLSIQKYLSQQKQKGLGRV